MSVCISRNHCNHCNQLCVCVCISLAASARNCVCMSVSLTTTASSCVYVCMYLSQPLQPTVCMCVYISRNQCNQLCVSLCISRNHCNHRNQLCVCQYVSLATTATNRVYVRMSVYISRNHCNHRNQLSVCMYVCNLCNHCTKRYNRDVTVLMTNCCHNLTWISLISSSVTTKRKYFSSNYTTANENAATTATEVSWLTNQGRRSESFVLTPSLRCLHFWETGSVRNVTFFFTRQKLFVDVINNI